MTTYNTGNPIGSTDARDLYDNAQNLDNFANGTSASYTDRLGVSRRSLAGIDSAADNVLNSIGYSVPVAYTSGISLTLTSQTVDYNGVIYAPKSSALPFTTSSWGTDSAKFRAIQVTDAALISVADAGGFYSGSNVEDVLQEVLGGVPVAGSLINERIGIVAGVIRQDSTDRTKWYYINDASHTPVGVSGTYATASGGSITVTYDTTYTKVISFVAGPDETFANALGATVGASVGLGASVISIGANFGGGFNVEYNGSNWVVANGTGQNINPSVTSYSNGTLTISHGYCRGIGASVTPWSKNGAVNPYMPLIKNIGNDSLEIQFIDTTTGNIVTSASPSTRMKAIVYKNNNTGLFADGTNGSNYINGIDPSVGANIWFFGIFQK